LAEGGEAGLFGELGLAGDFGLAGELGLAGDFGLAGDLGLAGESGLTGLLADAGDFGLTGLLADAGLLGETGLFGEIGDLGEIGLFGEAVETAVCTEWMLAALIVVIAEVLWVAVGETAVPTTGARDEVASASRFSSVTSGRASPASARAAPPPMATMPSDPATSHVLRVLSFIGRSFRSGPPRWPGVRFP